MVRIEETWGGFCDKLVFVLSDQDEETPEKIGKADIWRLPVKRKQSKNSRNIWEKVWRMWLHVYNNHLNDAEFFSKSMTIHM
eukprot:UN24415